MHHINIQQHFIGREKIKDIDFFIQKTSRRPIQSTKAQITTNTDYSKQFNQEKNTSTIT